MKWDLDSPVPLSRSSRSAWIEIFLLVGINDLSERVALLAERVD